MLVQNLICAGSDAWRDNAALRDKSLDAAAKISLAFDALESSGTEALAASAAIAAGLLRMAQNAFADEGGSVSPGIAKCAFHLLIDAAYRKIEQEDGRHG